MRAGFGLLSLLIAVAIILMVSFSGPKGGYVTNVVKRGGEAREQAEQISGVDDNGMRAQDSIKLDEESSGGKFKGLLVTGIVVGGPLQKVYGLTPGDVILETGPMNLRDQGDADMAKALVYESYQRNWPIVINRNGDRMTLQPNSALTKYQSNLFPNAANAQQTQTPAVPPAPVPTH